MQTHVNVAAQGVRIRADQVCCFNQSAGVRFAQAKDCHIEIHVEREAAFLVLADADFGAADADGATRALRPGDWCLLPAGCRHRVEETDADTLWLAVHLPA